MKIIILCFKKNQFYFSVLQEKSISQMTEQKLHRKKEKN